MHHSHNECGNIIFYKSKQFLNLKLMVFSMFVKDDQGFLKYIYITIKNLTIYLNDIPKNARGIMLIGGLAFSEVGTISKEFQLKLYFQRKYLVKYFFLNWMVQFLYPLGPFRYILCI